MLRRKGGQLAAASVMMFLWIALYALEVSPGLHRLLHEDAQSPAHNCLITQFQHHLVLSVFAATAMPALPELSMALPGGVADLQLHPSYDYRLSPSRAPPVA